jgi:predicted glycosyltransferase
VLGLREVLDDPECVRAEWKRSRAFAVLRHSYDAIWVYGDPRVYDPAVEYGLPSDLREMVRYTGYLGRPAGARPTPVEATARRRELGLPDGRVALCLLGGGEDGHRLAEAFARAELPAGTTGVIVAGPFMPDRERAALEDLAAGRHDLRVLGYVPDAGALVPLADDVVAMGGYNTTCEILSSGARALIVPRAEPRREQLIRAQRLSERGAVEMLAPHELSATALATWLAAGGAPRRRLHRPIDMGGLRCLPALLDDVLAPPSPRAGHGGALQKRRFRLDSPQRAPLSGGVPA